MAWSTIWNSINPVFWFYLYFFEILDDGYFNNDASHYFVSDNQIAASGYDLTEYFISNEAVKGDTTYSHEFDGVTYLLANEQNQSLFKENPQIFLPQYGGYCAFGPGMEDGGGIGMNKPGKYPSTPTSFKVVDNKLYLFFEAPIFHAKEMWELNDTKFINNANSA